uniref:Uncharacterized protein n=1 Tax=Lepeophtheirus salmonis TaxID=72036 RepID=A0A0K2UVN8_LEPSM
MIYIQRWLKEEAIPSKCPNLASYLSSPSPPPRPTQSLTSTNRVHLEKERQEALEYAMFMEKTILSAQDLYDKLFSESHWDSCSLKLQKLPL